MDFCIDGAELKKYTGKDKEVFVPEEVQILGENCFANRKDIEIVNIGPEVRIISKNAFYKRYNEQLVDYGIIYGTGKRVALIKTGQNGSVYGYNNKYLKMAKHINLQYGCTVVVSSNPYDCTDSLGQALEVIKQEVNQDVDVYYMGISNGAILGARFGHLHSEIKRMLLVNGPLMINWPQTKKGLEKFEGESVTMVYGELDPSYKYAEMVKFIDNPGKIRLVTIEGADHNFKNMDECFQSLPEEYLFY